MKVMMKQEERSKLGGHSKRLYTQQVVHTSRREAEGDGHCRVQRPANPASGAKDAPLRHPWLVEKTTTMETPGARLEETREGS